MYDTGGPGPEHIAEKPRDGLLRALRRTRAAVEEETAALSAGAHADHGDFRHRKDLCLLELSRRASSFAPLSDDLEIASELRALKDAVIRNQRMLRCHVNAARSMSAIIMRAISEEDSDRTYSSAPARRSPWT